jgi:hypothetical protein
VSQTVVSRLKRLSRDPNHALSHISIHPNHSLSRVLERRTTTTTTTPAPRLCVATLATDRFVAAYQTGLVKAVWLTILSCLYIIMDPEPNVKPTPNLPPPDLLSSDTVDVAIPKNFDLPTLIGWSYFGKYCKECHLPIGDATNTIKKHFFGKDQKTPSTHHPSGWTIPQRDGHGQIGSFLKDHSHDFDIVLGPNEIVN